MQTFDPRSTLDSVSSALHQVVMECIFTMAPEISTELSHVNGAQFKLDLDMS